MIEFMRNMSPEAEDTINYQPYLPGFTPELPLKNLPENLPQFQLCEEIADRLAQETNQSLPIDIEAVAKFCGIAKTTELHTPGRLGSLKPIGETSDDYYHLKLHVDPDPQEKRITVAHELGHRILRAMGRKWKSSIFENDGVEEFCDRFARAILAPRSLLLPKITAVKVSSPEQLDWTRFDLIRRELYTLSKETHLPPPYLARRIAEDLEASAVTLMTVSMGPIRPTRLPHRDPYRRNWVYWRNTPFQFDLPEEADREYCLELINEKLTSKIYDNWLSKLEVNENGIIDGEVYLGIKQPEKTVWLDIFKAKARGIILSQESIPTYTFAALRFERVAEVEDFWDGDFPLNYLLPHLIMLRVKERPLGGYVVY